MASPTGNNIYDCTGNIPSICQLAQHKTSNSDFIDDLTHLLTTIGSEKRNIVLLGDLNLHTDNPEDPNTDQLIATIEAFGMKQHIKFPTHQLGHNLDLIATESSTKLTCAPILGPYLSDHRMVIIETNNKKPTNCNARNTGN